LGRKEGFKLKREIWNWKNEFPDWYKKYPFKTEKEKKPLHITREKFLPVLFGGGQETACQQMVGVSTDYMPFAGYADIPPGGRVDWPDIHYGDQFYYAVKGTITVLNREMERAFSILEGSCIWIPKETWHEVQNLTDKTIRIFTVIAPEVWKTETGGPTAEDRPRKGFI
jgi:mannose-6-phosphate isomerase-like protein (cupin superfamily)